MRTIFNSKRPNLFIAGNFWAYLWECIKINKKRESSMAQELKNHIIAIIVADGFEESELAEPKKALEHAGATVKIVSPNKDFVQAWQHDTKSRNYPVDVTFDGVDPHDFDALVLPGGVRNPDTLRLSEDVIQFITDIALAHKPIAAICHGPWTLINAGVVAGKTVTSWPSLRVDLENAGAKWVDKEVVVDGNLVTSRKPADLPAFNRAMITLFASHKKK